MSTRYLGGEFDIHGGGIDLRFPHHENETAQARAAGMPYARYWMHNGWVTAAEEKMSKSLGNALAVHEVINQVRPVELRYYLGSAHYRSTIEFSFEALREAGASYRRLENFVRRAAEITGPVDPSTEPVCADFQQAMDDDLGVPAALAAVHDVVRAGNGLLGGGDSPALRGTLASVRAMLQILGVDPLAEPWVHQGGPEAGDERWERLVRSMVAAREQARARRDFALADALRDVLTQGGVAVEDTPAGPRWESA
jgi:cysteinyl-tRNA synthetase